MLAYPQIDLAVRTEPEGVFDREWSPRTITAFIQPLVLVIAGSDTDLPMLKPGLDILDRFDVGYDLDTGSSGRHPLSTGYMVTKAASRGIKVIIATSGGVAAPSEKIVSYTNLPVIVVPVRTTYTQRSQSLFNTVHMPRGVPTATVGTGNTTNAVLFAMRILGTSMPDILKKLEVYKDEMDARVITKRNRLTDEEVEAYMASKKSRREASLPFIP